jgi:hypothetical protein
MDLAGRGAWGVGAWAHVDRTPPRLPGPLCQPACHPVRSQIWISPALRARVEPITGERGQVRSCFSRSCTALKGGPLPAPAPTSALEPLKPGISQQKAGALVSGLDLLPVSEAVAALGRRDSCILQRPS